MAVYFIQAGEGGPVKIGRTDDVQRRLGKMQSDNPATLTIIRKLAGGSVEEANLHRRFADLRLRGEWFTFTPEMQTCDATGPEKLPAPRTAAVKGSPEHISKMRHGVYAARERYRRSVVARLGDRAGWSVPTRTVVRRLMISRGNPHGKLGTPQAAA